MKINFLHIISILCLFSLLSCAGESKYEDGANNNEMDLLAPTESKKEKVTFETNPNELNEEQLIAFKTRAEQKVKDFFDYVKIISDPKVGNDFKLHSLGLANDLFVNDTCTIIDSLLIGEEILMVTNYLNGIKNSKNKVIIVPRKIEFITDFSLDSSGNYSAVIKAKFIAKGKILSKNLEVYLLETEKMFGETAEKTIEVKLGNIY